REDRGGRLALQLVECDSRVLALLQPVRAHLDERPDERLVLVERRPSVRAMLLEGERQVGAFGELRQQRPERAETEAAQRVVEVRRTHGHASVYAAAPNPPLCRFRADASTPVGFRPLSGSDPRGDRKTTGARRTWPAGVRDAARARAPTAGMRDTSRPFARRRPA